MNDVNDLNRTTNNPNQQPKVISLSAVKNNPSENKVSINTTNGLSGVSEDNQHNERQVIKINPNRTKPSHRTLNSNDSGSIHEINPNDYIEKPKPAPSVTPRDKAMGLLADAVNRKQEEYKQFVEDAIEKDKINRENVEAGLETVGEEVQYLPDSAQTPMDESDKVHVLDDNSSIKKNYINNMDESEEDLVEEDFDPSENETVEPSSVKVVNSFYDESDDTKEDEDTFTEDDSTESYDEVEEADNDESETVNEPSSEEMAEENEEQDEVVDTKVEEQNEEVSEEQPREDIDKIVQDSITRGSFDINSSTIKDDTSTDDFEIDTSDFEDLSASSISTDEEEISDEKAQELYELAEKNLKSEILKKIIQAGKKLDTSQFVVSNKVINVKEALKGKENKIEKTATWPMMFANRPFKASALKGPEIAILYETDDSDSRNTVGITIEQAKILFEHDANPYRPATLEAWAKTIPIYDVESIFAALYLASLKDANYIPMACEKVSCQHAFLTDNIDIESMVKFKDDALKERFNKIRNTELTPENSGTYESVVNVINDKFAVGIKIPSIYTMLYEYKSLSDEFVEKYSTMVSIIHYIDYIYSINEETMQFQPIGWKTYPGDNAKTFKSKIATYSKILKEFDDTDFSILAALINSIINRSTDQKLLTYEIPVSKCPKCGSDISSRVVFPRSMLFTRQRLVELATTPTER